jgi:hypothetical protein
LRLLISIIDTILERRRAAGAAREEEAEVAITVKGERE